MEISKTEVFCIVEVFKTALAHYRETEWRGVTDGDRMRIERLARDFNTLSRMPLPPGDEFRIGFKHVD